MLKLYGITNKPIIELNEHNSEEKSLELLALLKSGKSAALTTDHGTPVISDPGWKIVDLCRNNNISVECIPGVSSVTAALSIAGIKIDEFVFFSRTPRKAEERKQFFIKLRKNIQPKVFIDAPYRLLNLLENIYYSFSKDAFVILCYELTTENELVKRGKISNIINFVKEKKLKGEYIIIVK